MSHEVLGFLEGQVTRVTKDLGITAKILPKEIRGHQYIAFTVYAGRRNILTSPIYKSNNIKLVNLAIGRLGVAKSIVKGTILTLALTVPLSIAESMLRKHKDLYYLFGYLATDILKVGIQALFVAIIGLTAASVKTLALAPMGLVIVIGLGTGWALNAIDNKYKLTEQLIKALETLPTETQSAAQFAGEGILSGIVRPGGMKSPIGGSGW